MIKSVLFIDDKDRESIFKSLRNKAKAKGLMLNLVQFNPGGAIESDLIDKKTKELKVKETVARYKERYSGEVFDAIACDWNLNVPNINGLELFRQLTAEMPFLRRIPKMMYSGTLDHELRKMLSSISEGIDDLEKNRRFDRFVANLKLLSHSEFFALSGRESTEEDLLPFLLKNEPLRIRLHHLLNDNPDHIFSVNCGGNHAGKRFKDVKREISYNEGLETELLQDITEEALSLLENKMATKNDPDNTPA